MLFQLKCCLTNTLLYLLISHTSYSQQLSMDDELAFSTVVGNESGLRDLMLRNAGNSNLIISKLVLQGVNATQFNLRTPITFPFEIAPGKSKSLSFSFEPKEGQSPGIVAGNLLLISNDTAHSPISIKLYGLVAAGMEGEYEPALYLITQVLGYGIDVGGDQLALGTQDVLIGEEVAAAVFKKAVEDQPVTMEPVARYSPKGQLPFGYYYRNKRDQLRYKKAGTLSDAFREHQTLFPRLLSGQTTFDPEDIEFGLFTSTSSHITHTEFNLNTGIEHAVRIYPLKNRDGQPIDNSFLVCFEEAENGDYQDFVFVVKNIQIVQ